jgi:hypothetical protein
MVTTPTMLSDVIKKLAPGRVELDVVAELGGRRALAHQLRRLRPDIVVIGLRRSESDAAVITLLTLLPKVKFIVFSHDAGSVTGYELRVMKTELSNLSPDQFVAFMRPDNEKTGI